MALLPAITFRMLALVLIWHCLSTAGGVLAAYPLAAMNPVLKGCRSNAESTAVAQAWREAGDLANAHFEWYPGGTWQAAMDMYMGTDTARDYDNWGDRGPLVGQSIGREWEVHFAGFGEHPVNTYAYIYCHEEALPRYDADKAFCGKDITSLAYSWDSLGIFWSVHYVVLCEGFWKNPLSQSLENFTRLHDGDIAWQLDMDNWMNNQALTMLHESYHWKDTVSVPRCNDLRYLPQEVADLAYCTGTKGSRMNAESFAEAAMAIWIQKTWNHANVPSPGGGAYKPGDCRNFVANISSTTDALDAPPATWTSEVNMNSPNFTWETVPGAELLSSYGEIVDPGFGDCLEGQLFWNLNQCMVFCVAGLCIPAGVNSYECGFCEDSGLCLQGTSYDSKYACQTGCRNGTCSYTAGTRAVTCTDCPCNAGTYDNFDDCAGHCGPGLCTEDAGVSGILCQC